MATAKTEKDRVSPKKHIPYIPMEWKHRDKEEKTHFSEEDILKQEEQFLAAYANPNAKALSLFFRLYQGHYRHLFLSSLFFIIKTSPGWFLPVVTERVIDIACSGDPNALVQILGWLLLELFLIAINLPTHYLHVRFLSLANRGVEAGLRGAMVRKLQQLSIEFHKEMASGRIQSKVMRDVESIEGLASQVFTSILDILLNITVALIAVASTNVTVLIFFVACAPPAAILTVAFRKRMYKRNRDFRQEVERTSAAVVEMENLVPVSRAHALENKEVRRLTAQLNLVAEKGYRMDVLQSLFGASSWIVFQVFRLLCLGFTTYMALIGEIEVGYIVMYQSYFSTVVGQISALMNLMPALTKGIESVRSVGEILQVNDIEDNTGKQKVPQVEGRFEFQNIFFSYDEDTPVLQNFNLSVKAGETIALVGESGAGKSTVLNLVLGFNRPTSGKVLLDGRDLNTLDLHSYRRHLAVVPQTSILFSGTIKDNITYGMSRVSKQQLNEVIDAADLRGLIERLPHGLNTVVGEHGDKMSGGQRQRIAIARALIRNPEIILLDEATSALDSTTEKEIQTAVENLTRNRTTFIVAHRLSTIRNADKIAVMAEGHCVEFGSYEELMAKKGEFYRMKQLQS